MLDDIGIDQHHFDQLINLARSEDLGEAGDLTSLLMDESLFTTSGTWEIVARATGRFAGAHLIEPLVAGLAPEVNVVWIADNADHTPVAKGDALIRLTGSVGQMLAAERVILNFLQHLSGVATMTSHFVEAVAGTHCKIYDTRKTTPGFRSLDKYAVRCGGGHNHRSGLHDAVLIKDNHVAKIPTERLAHAIMTLLNGLDRLPSEPAFVEVECDDLAQFTELLKVVGIDVILLDNFDRVDMATAVGMRDDAGLRGKIELEASGGITLETVRGVAEAGVDRIAVGAITHSAPALDLGLDFVA